VLISISGFLAWTDILPKYDHYTALKVMIEEKGALLAKREEIFQKVTKLQRDYQEKYTELERLSLVVPEDKDLPEMISTVDNIFSISGTIPDGLAIGTGKGAQESLTNNLTFEVTTETTYESLLDLLGYLEKNIRLIDILSLVIGTKPDAVLNGTSFPLSVQFKGTAYYLKPLDEVTKPPEISKPAE
jgi:hypothetical protein